MAFSDSVLRVGVRAVNLLSAVVVAAVAASTLSLLGSWHRLVWVASVPVVLGLFWLVRLRRIRLVFECALVCMLVAQLLIVIYIELDYVHMMFDAGRVSRSAMAWADGGRPEYRYFALYPFNQYITYIMVGVLKAVGMLGIPVDIHTLMVFNVLVVDISILMTCLTARLYLPEKWVCAVGIVCAASPAFVMFIPICYSDTLSLPFLTTGAYLMLRHIEVLRGNRRKWMLEWLSPLCAGALLYAGFVMKGCPLFALMAMTAYAFVLLSFRKWAVMAAVVVAGCLLCLGGMKFMENRLGLVDPVRAERCRLPLTHNIMMGLRGLGGYDGEDVNYTRSFGTMEEKRAATMAKIRERLGEMGPWGLMRKFFDKSAFTWTYGNCGASGYIGDNDMLYRWTFVHAFVLSIGKLKWFTTLAGDLAYFPMLLLVLVGAVREAWSDRVSETWPLRLFVVACMLFFMVWEAHPRYSFHARLAVILLGCLEASRMVPLKEDADDF